MALVLEVRESQVRASAAAMEDGALDEKRERQEDSVDETESGGAPGSGTGRRKR